MNKANQIVSEFEQLETEVISTAQAISAYFHALAKNRIPMSLATALTTEFARQWWTSQLGLNEQHVYMHNDFIEGEE